MIGSTFGYTSPSAGLVRSVPVNIEQCVLGYWPHVWSILVGIQIHQRQQQQLHHNIDIDSDDDDSDSDDDDDDDISEK